MPRSREFPAERRRALEAAGGIAYWQGDMVAAQPWYDECLELTRAAGDTRDIANALYNDAFPMLVNAANLPRAHELLDEALPMFRELDDTAGVARSLWALGNYFYFDRRNDEATAPLDEAVGLFRKLGDEFSLAWALHTGALVAMRAGDAATAGPLVREALRMFSETSDVSGIVMLLDDAAQLARIEGDPVRATHLAGAAAAHQASSGAGLGTMLNLQEGWTGREGLSDEDGAKAWAEGQAMSVEQAVAYALDETTVRT